MDDFAAGKSVVGASGAIETFRLWQMNPKSVEGPVFPRGVLEAAIHFGAEFNRKIDSKDPTKDINSLTLRAGGELEIKGSNLQYVRANIFDATDFDFDSHIVGGEVEWEPVNTRIGIGQALPLGNLPIYYRWRPILHAEYQNVVDAGGSGKLTQGASYLFAGPVLSGQLFFGGVLENLWLDTTYWALWDLTGAASPFQYFDFAANWGIDAKGHVALTAKYRAGNLPKTRDAVNDVRLGLTAKF